MGYIMISKYTNKNIKIYVVICDLYLWLLKPFCYLFNKYWGDGKEVNILGYKKPNFELPENFNFISLGDDPGPEKWTTCLYEFFDNIDDEHFIFMHEDSFFVEKVNFEILDKLLTFTENEKVGRICLTRDTVNREHESFEEVDGLDVIQAAQDVNFRISTEASIWKKSYFLKYMTKDTSAWKFESAGSSEARNDGFHILSTRHKNGPPDDAPLSLSNAIWRGTGLNIGKTNYPNLGYEAHLDFSVIEEMLEKDIISEKQRIGIIYNSKWKWFNRRGNLEHDDTPSSKWWRK
jgi:hypothetical protein